MDGGEGIDFFGLKYLVLSKYKDMDRWEDIDFSFLILP